MRVTLLLTSCIEPNQFKEKVKRNEPTQRLNDYLSAIEKWNIHKWPCDVRIVYVDNSGYPLHEIKQKINTYFKPILLSYQAEIAPEGMHYGYSEIEMITKSILRENFWDENEWVIKITGRLYFPAINRLIHQLTSKRDWVSDVRAKKWNKSGYSYIPSSIFAFKVGFLKKHLSEAKTEMVQLNLSHLELYLFHKINPIYEKEKDKIMIRLPFNLNPEGVGAHWNKTYGNTSDYLVQTTRACLRKIAPFLWV